MPRGVFLVVAAVVLVACGSGPTGDSSPSPASARTPAPTVSAAASPGATERVLPSPSPSPTPGADMTPAPASPAVTATHRPTAQDSAVPVAVRCMASRAFNVFAAGLLDDMARRDAKALEARMGRAFTFVVEATDVDIPEMSAREAVRTLLTGLREDGFLGSDGRPAIVPLARAAHVRCAPGVPLDGATGRAILGRSYDAAFLATGWGTGGDEEAFVFLARTASGRILWRGTWYSTAGFER